MHTGEDIIKHGGRGLACVCMQVWSNLAEDILLGVELRIWLVGIALEGDALPERHALWRIDGIHLIVCGIGGAQDLQRANTLLHLEPDLTCILLYSGSWLHMQGVRSLHSM